MNSIESYLILPVQRIPRYYLLLEDFLLHTDTSHRDYNDLVKAVQMIKNIADYVNNRMKTLEHMNRVYQIDVELGGECKVCHYLSLFMKSTCYSNNIIY